MSIKNGSFLKKRLNELLDRFFVTKGDEIKKNISSKFELSLETADRLLTSVTYLVISIMMDKVLDGDVDFLNNISFQSDVRESSPMTNQFFGNYLNPVVENLTQKLCLEIPHVLEILKYLLPIILTFFLNNVDTSTNQNPLFKN